MKNLQGHFYYKKTANGNLIGEFSNNNLKIVQPELAELDNNPESFKGTFDSCWLEFGNATMLKLEIDYKPDTDMKIFELTWRNGDKICFRREGFIVDDMLIGSYSDTEIQ